MVEIAVEYQGGLRCRAVHGPSGAVLLTDAPVDNHGRGESFSPTDLVATSLGACMLTVMGIVAERHGWPLAGARAHVVKHMVADPARRIGKLTVRMEMPAALDERARTTLVAAAYNCPVHESLGQNVQLDITFTWTLTASGTSA